MADFLFSSLTGDLDLGENNSDGLRITTDPKTEIEQSLAQALGLNFTEWFLDITKGLPYIKNPNEDTATNLRYFLGDKSPNAPQFIKSSLDSYIGGLSFIDSLKSSFTFDNKSRVFVYTYSVTSSGMTIEFPSQTINL